MLKVSGRIQPGTPTRKDIRQGFVYERAPHVTLKSIANNAEIDVIWEQWERTLEPLRAGLTKALDQSWEEWQVPREADKQWPEEAPAASCRMVGGADRPAEGDRRFHGQSGRRRVPLRPPLRGQVARARRRAVHRREPVAAPVVTARDDTLADELAAAEGTFQPGPGNAPDADFGQMVLEHLATAGVQQQVKGGRISFSSLEPWPGKWIAGEGRYEGEDGRERRAGIFIGPEFGATSRADLTAAAREASDARFDVLIACAFSYDAHASELNRLGPLPILKARMNPDLHMADELKNTGKGNLFVVFGEPDIDIIERDGGEVQVKVNGIDVFDPATGEIRSADTAGIACWFIDTDYDEESFFVRHAYFLGANDPYKALKTTLKAKIDAEAWETLYSDTSRPFARPESGRIAVKVINHFGDEVLKVIGV